MSNHKYKEYKEFGRTEIAVTGFVLNRLLTRPDVASSHFAMQEVIPENVKKAACVKGDPGYKYYLIQLGALDAEKMKVALRVEVLSEVGAGTTVKVVGSRFLAKSEINTFDFVGGLYIPVN